MVAVFIWERGGADGWVVLNLSARHAVLPFCFFVSFFFLDLSQCRALHSVLLGGGAGSEDSLWTQLPDPSLLVVIPTKMKLGSHEPQTKVPTLGACHESCSAAPTCSQDLLEPEDG